MSKGLYGFVRDADGRLVPTSRERDDQTSRTELLDRFKKERARTSDALANARGRAGSLERVLRKSDSQPKLARILSIVPPPEDDGEPAE